MTAAGAETIVRPARAGTAVAGATLRRRQGFQHGGWFVAPFLALFALFVVWPLLRGLYLSFTDANISGDEASFIGLDNYREALQDPLMWDALGHSAYFTLLVVPCITVLAFLLAMLAHHIERGKWLWRLCFFLPRSCCRPPSPPTSGSGCSTPAPAWSTTSSASRHRG